MPGAAYFQWNPDDNTPVSGTPALFFAPARDDSRCPLWLRDLMLGFFNMLLLPAATGSLTARFCNWDKQALEIISLSVLPLGAIFGCWMSQDQDKCARKSSVFFWTFFAAILSVGWVVGVEVERASSNQLLSDVIPAIFLVGAAVAIALGIWRYVCVSPEEQVVTAAVVPTVVVGVVSQEPSPTAYILASGHIR